MLVANPRKQKLLIQVKDSLGFADLTIGTGEVNYLILKKCLFYWTIRYDDFGSYIYFSFSFHSKLSLSTP